MHLPSTPRSDILGPEYEMIVLDMGTDYEGKVVATVVRRQAERTTGRAVLYIHGYNDYFFQKHLADFYVSNGISFYGLDLRKYGRSILPHQTPYLCRSLDEYFPDIDAAIRIMQKDGHDRLILSGHSAGGLIACVWADQCAAQQFLSCMVLNSPYLGSGIPGLAQPTVIQACRMIARRWPGAVLPWTLSPRYARSLHQDYSGEWEFDTTWKSVTGTTVSVAWLASVQEGQHRVSNGLSIEVPILVMCSTSSSSRKASLHELLAGDGVLNVGEIARLAPRLGRNVTVVRIPGAIHDVFLSAQPVRSQALKELSRWLCLVE